MQRVREEFKNGEGLCGRDDDSAIVRRGPRLDMLDGVLSDELMPLADLVGPVHQPFNFAHGCPSKILVVMQGLSN